MTRILPDLEKYTRVDSKGFSLFPQFFSSNLVRREPCTCSQNTLNFCRKARAKHTRFANQKVMHSKEKSLFHFLNHYRIIFILIDEEKKFCYIYSTILYSHSFDFFFLRKSCPRRDNKLKIPRKLCRHLHNNAIHWQREKSVNVHKRPLELSFIVQQNFSQGELRFQNIIYKSPWLYPVPKKN